MLLQDCLQSGDWMPEQLLEKKRAAARQQLQEAEDQAVVAWRVIREAATANSGNAELQVRAGVRLVCFLVVR